MDRPNIIFTLTDEERYPPPHELDDEKLMTLRHELLKGHNFLRKHSVEFHNHNTAATACTPSRSVLFEGKPIHVTGRNKTSGFDKQPGDSKLTWLPKSPDMLTIGHYMRKLGYDTHYVGKWHLSPEETTHDLEEFGFSSWFGPEPHGPDFEKSGLVNDPLYIQKAIEIIEARSKDETKKNIPFFFVICLVNPHDFVLFPRHALRTMRLNKLNYKFNDPPKVTEENLSTVAKIFSKKYETLMLPVALHRYIHSRKHEMKNFYLDMIVEADKHINDFMEFFSKTKYYDNTFVLFSSDHGEMGFSKDLLQKFYVPYREAIHVPFIIHHKNIPMTVNYGYVTSSLDIFPTIISLACKANDINNIFNSNYGRSLRHIVMNALNLSSSIVHNNSASIEYSSYNKEDIEYIALFQTEDDLFEGNSSHPIYYLKYPILTGILIKSLGHNKPITCPKYIKTVISYEKGELYKLSKYYFKNNEEWEMFNMTKDPSETINIINDSNYREIVDIMKIKMIFKFSPEVIGNTSIKSKL
ncbi:MAG: DUF229 domain-containing protein [Terrestrivirus sp.]|uniref:DUF229 domain-containing protein n=1 Tax=Terrestrivirus sp. TaxID=2487775 RepID=A0A3G4ZMA0_9VIRU|nr:MAG: DUF229 domain-containing protein [Terrestrivirus sp.]